MFPYIDNRNHAKFSDELRLETLVVWQEAVTFFNHIMSTAQHFPDADPFDLKNKIETSGLRVVDLIARCAYAKSRKSFEHSLKQAREAISETIASLYVSQKWNYTPQGMYEQLYTEGDMLSRKLKVFSGESNFSESQLN